MPLSRPPNKQAGNERVTDEELAERLLQGEVFALSVLMQRHKQALYRVIWRHVGHEEDAYDLLQETFFKVQRKIALYDPAYRFKPWLYQIAVNLCRDHLRHRKLRRWLGFDGVTHDVADETPTPEQDIAIRQEYRQVQQAIDGLPLPLRSAFILFTVEEHSLAECAALLNVTPKTIETRVYRARKILSGQRKDFLTTP